jgi:hypothetical protein
MTEPALMSQPSLISQPSLVSPSFPQSSVSSQFSKHLSAVSSQPAVAAVSSAFFAPSSNNQNIFDKKENAFANLLTNPHPTSSSKIFNSSTFPDIKNPNLSSNNSNAPGEEVSRGRKEKNMKNSGEDEKVDNSSPHRARDDMGRKLIKCSKCSNWVCCFFDLFHCFIAVVSWELC